MKKTNKRKKTRAMPVSATTHKKFFLEKLIRE